MSFEEPPHEADDREVAIRTVGLGKSYHVYERPRDRLKQLLWPRNRQFYKEFLAVRGVDMEIRRGEAIGIVGRNGSGKSTLLQMICGTLESSTGHLEINGHVAPILSIGAGFDLNFTGRENVQMNAAVIGIPQKEIQNRMVEIEEFANIGDFFDRPVRSYSSGMAARLAFAVAINANPDILVVDEVLAVGDSAFARKCLGRINEIKESGSTILFVSHAADLVLDLCDRAILLEDGEQIMTGEPKQVISWYHRLLYAPPERIAEVREEIAQIEVGGIQQAAEPSDPGESEAAFGTHSIHIEEEPEGFFDPGLKTESRVEYSHQGAKIIDPRILDSNENQVNVLIAGREYTYAYEVIFHEPGYLVRFGMLIKRVTGQELGGQASHPKGSGIEFTSKGHVAHVRFRFRALFTPGHFFMNAGVLGIREGEETYLHRIIDAYVFRIEPVKDLLITGDIDLSADENETSVKLLAPLEESS